MSEYIEFELKNGMVGKVDKKDWPEIVKYKWRAAKNSKSPNANWYIRGNSPPITGIFMHRMLLKAPTKSYVDHINGDGLDNRRSNIRLANALENARNRKSIGKSKYKGVSVYGKSFQASITIKGKYKYLGRHDSEIKAAIAYDLEAIKHKFFNPNFPRELYYALKAWREMKK